MDNVKSDNTIAVAETATKAPIQFGSHGVQLQSIDEAFRFARAVVASGWAPKGMEKPESVMIAIQFGMEIGLTPMAALQNMAVINGRPAIYGAVQWDPATNDVTPMLQPEQSLNSFDEIRAEIDAALARRR